MSICSFFPATTPANRSLCPPIYFVALCKTKSAPYSIGLMLIGVANVESMTDTNPLLFVTPNTFSKSITLKKGFVGNSEKKRTELPCI